VYGEPRSVGGMGREETEVGERAGAVEESRMLRSVHVQVVSHRGGKVY
jgi:hypothetical protein